jgi:outer membrane lipoprotein SlyB
MQTLRKVVVGTVTTLLVCCAAAASEQPVRIAPLSGPPLHVDGFDVEQVPQLSAGTPLTFSLFGTPGASAALRIDGAQRPLRLQEVQTGVYEGTYVIAVDDRITAASRVTADLWLANQAASVVLEEPLLLGGSAVRPCDDCGVVETVRAVDVDRAPGPMGAIAGGLIGAIVGSQVGKGDGRRAVGILGALGGAIAGREIERAHAKRTRYELVVRLRNGVTQTRRYDTQPPFKVGDRVRLADGAWKSDPSALP